MNPEHSKPLVTGAATASTRFVEIGDRKLAYRSVGEGKPIVLCNRFRGVLDLLNLLKSTSVPALHISADHDIIFPVENWYALSGLLPTLQLVTFPRAGHGPHHQHPEVVAKQIAAFVGGEARSNA